MNFANAYQLSSLSAPGYSDTLLNVDEISDSLPPAEDLKMAFSRVVEDIHIKPAVKFRIVLEGPLRTLDPWIEEYAYRIGREALLNAFCHSEANTIELYIRYAHTGLHVAVRDNGKGMSEDLLRMGCNGLSWMKQLANRIGAKFRLFSRTSAGTEVILLIPGDIAFADTKQRRWQAA